MDYLEKFIKNSWDKIPVDFKYRIEDYEIVLSSEELLNYKKNRIVFSKKYLDSRIQKFIDKLVIDAIALKYGFTEEEAHKLLSKIYDNRNI